uniref:Candidate secreted effector n=3 Tax=Meloidogyne incognita group TaxID=654580 RepID=A0A914KXP6_MELIC
MFKNIIFIQIYINFIFLFISVIALDGNKNIYGPNYGLVPGFLCSPSGLPPPPQLPTQNPSSYYSPSLPLSSNPYTTNNFPLPPPPPQPPLPPLPFYSPPSPSISPINSLLPQPPSMNLPLPPPPPMYGTGYPVINSSPIGSYFCIPYCPQSGNSIGGNFPSINNYSPPLLGSSPSNIMNPANLSPSGYGIGSLGGYGQLNPQMGGGGGALPFSGAYIHTEPSTNIGGINGPISNGGNIPPPPLMPTNNIWPPSNGIRRSVEITNNDENKKKIIAKKERKGV